MIQDELCDTIQGDIKVKTDANVYNPFEEFVQQVGVKPLEDVYAIVDDEMSVDLIRKFYLKEVNLQLYEVPIFVQMINQLKMIKLVSLRSVIGFHELLTILMCWSAISYYELGSALVDVGSLKSTRQGLGQANCVH